LRTSGRAGWLRPAPCASAPDSSGRLLITAAAAENQWKAVAPLNRLILVIAALAVAETAWALLCAETGANLLLFYGVLVAASAVLWIPGLTEKRGAR
jgi:hypothetical protein